MREKKFVLENIMLIGLKVLRGTASIKMIFDQEKNQFEIGFVFPFVCLHEQENIVISITRLQQYLKTIVETYFFVLSVILHIHG